MKYTFFFTSLDEINRGYFFPFWILTIDHNSLPPVCQEFLYPSVDFAPDAVTTYLFKKALVRHLIECYFIVQVDNVNIFSIVYGLRHVFDKLK